MAGGATAHQRRIALPDRPGTTIALGWDWPLASFFAIVQTEGPEPELDDPTTHLWAGADGVGTLPTIDALQEAIKVWYRLSDEDQSYLQARHDQNPATLTLFTAMIGELGGGANP
jgi:hypothetical protein